MAPLGGSVVGYRTVTPPAPYAGPGDVVSSATGWWGLRAYSSATKGSNAIRLRRDSDNSELDFVTLTSTGALDTASISSFKGAANLFVVKMYDQTGNGNDFAQTSAGNQPSFSLTAGISSGPALNVSGGAYLTNTTLTNAQPFTMSTVMNFNPTGSGPNQGRLWQISGLGRLENGISTANQIAAVAGTAFGATMSDNAWHAVQAVFNSASSVLGVDGTDTTGDVSTGGPMSGTQVWFQDGGFGFIWSGIWEEMGLWPSVFSSGDRTSMNSNQHTYWGF